MSQTAREIVDQIATKPKSALLPKDGRDWARIRQEIGKRLAAIEKDKDVKAYSKQVIETHANIYADWQSKKHSDAVLQRYADRYERAAKKITMPMEHVPFIEGLVDYGMRLEAKQREALLAYFFGLSKSATPSMMVARIFGDYIITGNRLASYHRGGFKPISEASDEVANDVKKAKVKQRGR